MLQYLSVLFDSVPFLLKALFQSLHHLIALLPVLMPEADQGLVGSDIGLAVIDGRRILFVQRSKLLRQALRALDHLV